MKTDLIKSWYRLLVEGGEGSGHFGHSGGSGGPGNPGGSTKDGGGSDKFNDTEKNGKSIKVLRSMKTGQEVEVILFRGEGTTDHRIASQFAVGTYWSPHKNVASTYGTSIRTEKIRLKNPYVFNLPSKKAYFLELKDEFGTRDPIKITELLKNKGHDSLVVRNVPVMRKAIYMGNSIEVILLNK